MTPTLSSNRTTLGNRLDEIIDLHGLMPVLRALVARPFRRSPPLPLDLSAHLRRDIGLEPMPPWGDPLL